MLSLISLAFIITACLLLHSFHLYDLTIVSNRTVSQYLEMKTLSTFMTIRMIIRGAAEWDMMSVQGKRRSETSLAKGICEIFSGAVV